MQSSLYTGISGLNANMSKLSVVGNNIANVNTVGFKGSRVIFDDVLSQTLSGGTGTNQIGLGVKMSSIQKIFSQGAFETTGNSLDMAISGSGFYMVKDPVLNSTYYSRAGQFTTDKDGYITNPEGLRLQGYMANSAGALQNTVQDLQLTTKTIAPNATTNATLTASLDSNASIPGFVITSGTNDAINFSVDGGTTWFNASLVSDGGLSSGSAYSGSSIAASIKSALEARNGNTDTYDVSYDDQTGLFSVTNNTGNAGTLVLDWSSPLSTASTILGHNAVSSGAIAAGSSNASDVAAGDFFLGKAGDTSNFSTPVTVYDSLGNDHVVTLYFRKDSLGSVGNNWDWYAVVDGTDTTSGATEIQAKGTISFNTSGALYSETGVTYPYGGFNFTGGALQSQIISFDFGNSIAQAGTGTDGTTQYGTTSGISALTQDGYSSGTLQRMGVDQDGVISGIFSNGKDLTLGQVLLADFASPVGLSSAGMNLYKETYDSGQPLIGAPGSSGRGLVQASTLELSNVDLAQEFVDMITAQRGFQANSKVITTTDELLAELSQLKR
ncbi:MAG: flagellar hook protein FlgE [Deltaproteobacteria bacterium]|nr:flagellar hook protein FlgE [Deltaproteobacteria bacterium]